MSAILWRKVSISVFLLAPGEDGRNLLEPGEDGCNLVAPVEDGCFLVAPSEDFLVAPCED